MILKGKQSKEKLLEGINETVDVAKITLGARGKTVLISDRNGLGFSTTKDGVTVINSVNFSDDIMNLGADYVKEGASKTVSDAGDGTTSTSILIQSMCNTIFKEIELGKNTNQLVKDLKEDLDIVTKFIADKSIKINNTDEIKNIAKVSSNNDEELGSLIKDIYDKAGMDVSIDIVESDDIKTSFEVVNGFTMRDTGYCSTQFINNRDKGRVEFNNPKILLFNGKVRTMTNEIYQLFEDNANRNSETFQPLVLIVEDIEEAPLREILMAHGNNLLHDIVVVQTNLIHEDRKNAFIDASIFLNAEYNEDKFSGFGGCDKVIIERENVTFINGKGNVTKHVAKLKAGKKKKNIAEQRRIFALESVAAIIKVGGTLGSEINEKKDRIEDAVYAVKSAIEEGYCPGGSTMYVFAYLENKVKTEVMKKALLACYIQLMKNAEQEPFYYLRDIEASGFGYGFNLLKEKISNFYEDGIFDSSKVLRVSIENAVHTACNFASVDAVISR
jgi:chaperonin GroEL